jgi:hypothetical protein
MKIADFDVYHRSLRLSEPNLGYGDKGLLQKEVVRGFRFRSHLL